MNQYVNQYSCVLSQAGEESESQTGRPYPYCQPAGHPGGKHQESLQLAWRWESIWTSTAFLVQFPEKMSLLKIHTAISSVQTQGIVRHGSSARREGMAQCNTGPLTFTLASSDCMWLHGFRPDQQDRIPEFLYWSSLTDATKMQKTNRFTSYKRSPPFQKTQRALLNTCPLPINTSVLLTRWSLEHSDSGIVPVDFAVVFNESRPIKRPLRRRLRG